MPVSNLNDYVPTDVLNVFICLQEGSYPKLHTDSICIFSTDDPESFQHWYWFHQLVPQRRCCLLWGGGWRGFDTPLYLSHTRSGENSVGQWQSQRISGSSDLFSSFYKIASFLEMGSLMYILTDFDVDHVQSSLANLLFSAWLCRDVLNVKRSRMTP